MEKQNVTIPANTASFFIRERIEFRYKKTTMRPPLQKFITKYNTV